MLCDRRGEKATLREYAKNKAARQLRGVPFSVLENRYECCNVRFP